CAGRPDCGTSGCAAGTRWESRWLPEGWPTPPIPAHGAATPLCSSSAPDHFDDPLREVVLLARRSHLLQKVLHLQPDGGLDVATSCLRLCQRLLSLGFIRELSRGSRWRRRRCVLLHPALPPPAHLLSSPWCDEASRHNRLPPEPEASPPGAR